MRSSNLSSEETSFISPLAGLRVLGVTVYLAGPFTLVNMMHQQAEWGRNPLLPETSLTDQIPD